MIAVPLWRGWILCGLLACSKHDAPAPPPSTVPVSAPATVTVDDRYSDAALGSLTFKLTEGTPAARAHFMRGLLALHSFWYDEALRQFAAAISADPTMNMAYWGAAMSQCQLLWGEDNLEVARRLLKQMPTPDKLSEREQAWIVAALQLVGEGDVRTTRRNFAQAMEELNKEFPDDESATFLAIALLSATPAGAPDEMAVRKRAAGLAATVFERNPRHPGAAHYIIHAYDTPELAPLGLPYARQYAQIAPAAFHARHMPAHIFSRLGMWKEAITSCKAAWDASLAATAREKLTPDHDDFHSLNWLIEMNFELGHRKEADVAFERFRAAVTGGLTHSTRVLYAAQVASYLIRTGEWTRVDELLAPLDTPATAPAAMPAMPAMPVPSSATAHCASAADTPSTALQEQLFVLVARARAAAAKHDVAKTTALADQIDAVGTELRHFLQATQSAEAMHNLDASNANRRAALLARAKGDDGALVAALRGTVTTAPGGESNPNGFLPEEEIGEALLRMNQPKQAAASFASALAKQPKRARSLLGLARAQTKLGNREGARASYRELGELWTTADDGTPGLDEVHASSSQ